MDHDPPRSSASKGWDEKTRTRFTWKFSRLVIELNAIILLVVLSIVIFFFFHSPFTSPGIGAMLGSAFMIYLDFRNKYQETKVWLDENDRTKIRSEDGN